MAVSHPRAKSRVAPRTERARPAAKKKSRSPKNPPADAKALEAREALLAWFDRHRRDLPWRRTRDPYAIWVSEVMLQQTRVETVVPYYTRFLERFPTPRALADAPLDTVLAAWSGLGYYRRARMLHAGARAVVADHGARVPGDAAALRALPGVGDYTAGAIASIAFGLCEPVLDGNVERVLSRVFAVRGDPRAADNRRHLWSLARAFVADSARPGDVNQSLMELGATVCAPASPRCLVCPLAKACAARAEGDPARYPEKRARAAVRDEAWAALCATDEARTRVWLVPSAIGRWTGMLLAPMAQDEPAPEARFARDGVRAIAPAGEVVHVLSHASMRVAVYTGTLAGEPAHGRLVPLDALDAHAVPRITRAVLERAGLLPR